MRQSYNNCLKWIKGGAGFTKFNGLRARKSSKGKDYLRQYGKAKDKRVVGSQLQTSETALNTL